MNHLLFFFSHVKQVYFSSFFLLHKPNMFLFSFFAFLFCFSIFSSFPFPNISFIFFLQLFSSCIYYPSPNIFFLLKGLKISLHQIFPSFAFSKYFPFPNIFFFQIFPSFSFSSGDQIFSNSRHFPTFLSPNMFLLFLPILRLQSPKWCKSTSFHWGLPLPPTPKKVHKIPNCKSPPELTPRLYLNDDFISKLNKWLSVYNLESDCELEAASFLTVWQRDNGLDWLGERAGEWAWVEKTRKCFFLRLTH